ncbi:hypothetical protein MHUMG1_00244 [Metarhizium humberi]|uniref:Uncharacterized protein n=1 Tax=Metarhizium humberi TaxID=2596975 RepID=A0A9P8MJA5_9HYPO|nr:hypothetical protein MHUMG1_00244 [Metarhizium humberi]
MLQRGLPVVSLMQGPRGRKQWHPAAAAAATADLPDMSLSGVKGEVQERGILMWPGLRLCVQNAVDDRHVVTPRSELRKAVGLCSNTLNRLTDFFAKTTVGEAVSAGVDLSTHLPTLRDLWIPTVQESTDTLDSLQSEDRRHHMPRTPGGPGRASRSNHFNSPSVTPTGHREYYIAH